MYCRWYYARQWYTKNNGAVTAKQFEDHYKSEVKKAEKSVSASANPFAAIRRSLTHIICRSMPGSISNGCVHAPASRVALTTLSLSSKHRRPWTAQHCELPPR